MMLLTLLVMASDQDEVTSRSLKAKVWPPFWHLFVSHMKRGRGRPSLKPTARAPKALALSADVLITQEFDDRGRPRAPLVEVARRTEGTALLVEDSIRVRVGSNWEFPSPISLAATLCDISDRVAHEIHAQFQREKELPDASHRGQYARKLELEQVFEPRLLFGWIRQI